MRIEIIPETLFPLSLSLSLSLSRFLRHRLSSIICCLYIISQIACEKKNKKLAFWGCFLYPGPDINKPRGFNMASVTANDMRVGWVISHNGKRYSVTSITKVKPGKGGAFVQADLRDIDSGTKGGDRWRAEDKVEKLMVEDRDCQYLYSDGTDAYFMNLSDYEQFPSEP